MKYTLLLLSALPLCAVGNLRESQNLRTEMSVLIQEVESLDSQSVEEYLNELTATYRDAQREYLRSLETSEPETLNAAVRDFSQVNQALSLEIEILRHYSADLRQQERKGGRTLAAGEKHVLMDEVIDRISKRAQQPLETEQTVEEK